MAVPGHGELLRNMVTGNWGLIQPGQESLGRIALSIQASFRVWLMVWVLCGRFQKFPANHGRFSKMVTRHPDHPKVLGIVCMLRGRLAGFISLSKNFFKGRGGRPFQLLEKGVMKPANLPLNLCVVLIP